MTDNAHGGSHIAVAKVKTMSIECAWRSVNVDDSVLWNRQDSKKQSLEEFFDVALQKQNGLPQ